MAKIANEVMLDDKEFDGVVRVMNHEIGYDFFNRLRFRFRWWPWLEDKFDNLSSSQMITRKLGDCFEWWPWLQKKIYQKGIFGYGCHYRWNIYEGYQKWCRFFDGMFTEENIRDILDIELTGPNEYHAEGAWELLKKYAE